MISLFAWQVAAADEGLYLPLAERAGWVSVGGYFAFGETLSGGGIKLDGTVVWDRFAVSIRRNDYVDTGFPRRFFDCLLRFSACKPDTVATIREAAVHGGLVKPAKNDQAKILILSLGPGYVEGEQTGANGSFATLGLSYAARIVRTTARFANWSVEVSGNFNSRQSFAQIGISIGFGLFH